MLSWADLSLLVAGLSQPGSESVWTFFFSIHSPWNIVLHLQPRIRVCWQPSLFIWRVFKKSMAGQQVEGCYPPPLICPDEATSGVLCPVLGSPVIEIQGTSWESPSLAIFKTCLITFLCNMLLGTSISRGLVTRWSLEIVPSPMILWLCEMHVLWYI